ncbi:phage head spike fiber domain-containing protein [Aeromonas sp. PS2Canimalfood6]|uniref:phage head spike fiber domain-containing protein n=1 Tax=Aeromonas sp. PS2Canimalfood6 TaxID=3397770 RepID=UPI003AA9294F
MAGVWKRDGTVAVTNGNKKVTGTGTTFADTKNGVAKGHLFCITSGTSVDFYEVDYVVSNTELYLVQSYRGTTATGKAYEIITTFSDSVPEFARRLTATLSAYQQQSDAFQALLTSNAAIIEVTAPDGTKQTLIPWKRVTSEGEGQAARAKAEADKAAASAALAGDIVLQSAMPLPDVWLPLNDDLRMITGFGGDVKVGELTVAKRANFERVTSATYIDKSTGLRLEVPANTPRFEAPGLLVEKASTNLFTAYNFTGSNMTSNNVENSILVKQTDPAMGGDYAQLRSVTAVAASRYIWLPSAPATEGQPYTVTVTVRRPIGSPITRVRLGCNDMTPVSVYVDLVEGGAVDVVLSGVLAAGKNTIKAFVWPHIGSDSTPAVPAGAALLDVGEIQIEPGNVSTSRIRSNGAQTRREQDKVWLQELGNMLPLNRDFTLSFAVAVQYDPAEYGCLYAAGIFPVITQLIFWPTASALLRFYVGGTSFAGLTAAQVSTILPPSVPRRVTLIRRGDVSEMWISGVKVATSSSSKEAGFTNGQIVIGADDKFVRAMPRMHVRDWRVWHFAASDAQAKTIR